VKTIAEVIRVQAARQPEQLGIWHEGSETSYAELDRRSSRVANALIAAGVRQGDRVCFLDKGHAEAMEAILGIAKAGAVFTPVNYRLAPSEMAYVISDAAAPLLLVGHECADAIRSIEAELTQLRSVVRWGEGPNSWQSYEGWRDAQLAHEPQHAEHRVRGPEGVRRHSLWRRWPCVHAPLPHRRRGLRHGSPV
jgi:acyl-CoA synthetase (AMP-forming)/AMP-acid ligase II